MMMIIIIIIRLPAELFTQAGQMLSECYSVCATGC